MTPMQILVVVSLVSTCFTAYYHCKEIKKLEEQLAEARKLAAELKQKLTANSHPILSLADLMNRGVILDVSIVDRSNMYFHNGSVR